MSVQSFGQAADLTAARPVRHNAAGLDRSLLIQWSTFAATIVLVIGPLLPIIYQSFVDRPLYRDGQLFTLGNYTSIATDGGFWTVIANSLVFALLSTIVAQVAGVLFAILVGRTDMPGRRIIGNLVLWPLFLSPLLLSMGWFVLYGPAGYATMAVRMSLGFEPWSLYSLAGMSLVAGVAQAPLTVLYCLASTALADPRLEDAARSCGATPLRAMLRISLPMLLPAIMFSAVLNFINALESLSIPLIFGQPAGIRLFMTFIYEEAFSGLQPNYGIVGSAAVVLLALISVLIWLQRRLLGDPRRFNSVGGKAARPRPLPLGGLRWPAFALAMLYALAFVILPLGAVVLRAFVPVLTPLIPFWQMLSLGNFQALLASGLAARAIGNTLAIALSAAVLGTLFATMVAMVVEKSPFRGRRPLEYVALFPRAVPGMIAGVGILYVLLFVPQLGWLRNSIWIIILAYVGRALPTGLGAVSPALTRISPDLDRAARVVGADWWTSMRLVVLRLTAPALFASFALMFIGFIKEYSTAIFLVAPGSEVLGVSILQAWNQGNAGGAAALATVQILLLVTFLFLARKLLGVKMHG